MITVGLWNLSRLNEFFKIKADKQIYWRNFVMLVLLREELKSLGFGYLKFMKFKKSWILKVKR